MKRNTWIIGGAAVVVVGGGAWALLRPKKDAVKWRMAPVARGPLQQRISATGTLSALVQVTVGSQVSGTIAALYVDYNSEVRKGQPIAQIDPTLLQATLSDAQAGLERANTSLEDAKRQLARTQRLAKEKLVSDQDLDARQVAFETAQANVQTAKAALERARTNLGYATITAPVSGVVVSRNVDVGQTVAASFNTPTLFLIAQDLTKMKLEASIDEADIGQVKSGQQGYFTVDSYPDTQFKGTVSQVRLEPITQQNVVTYKVVMEVDNEDLKLRPGMTANVAIQTQSRDSVLKVPSAALRFNPMAFLPADPKSAKGDKGEKADKADKGGDAKSGERGGQGRGANAAGGGRPGGQGGAQGFPGAGRMGAMAGAPASLPVKGMVTRRDDRIWVLENGKPKSIAVRVGITDGQFTEISGEGLQEGMQVLVGVEETKRASGPAPLTGGMGPGGGPRR
jgi:HlyD family secretion protein